MTQITKEDYYNITVKDFYDHGGSYLLSKYIHYLLNFYHLFFFSFVYILLPIYPIILQYFLSILICINNSTHELLESVFGGEWQAWRFVQVSSGYWSEYENCLDFMKYLYTFIFQ